MGEILPVLWVRERYVGERTQIRGIRRMDADLGGRESRAVSFVSFKL
jgi:hypothetical protein